MVKVKRNWDLISEEQRKANIEEIINFFQNERDEEIGIIAAEDLLDFCLQTVGMEIYNKGIEDSKNFIKTRFEDLELDIESFKK